MSLKNASLSIKSSLLVTEAILIEIEANFVAPSFVLSLKFDIDLLFLNYGSLERQVTSFKENLCSCVMFTICTIYKNDLLIDEPINIPSSCQVLLK